MAKKTETLVLVADDEPSMLALVSSYVKSKGFKVIEASDGDQAWQMAHTHLPDLVILDVMMPGMSGWEVCRKIREAISLAHTGVVMLTGIGENLNEMTSPLYGADTYIDKPFEFSDLDRKIEQTLSKRRGGVLGREDEADRESATLEDELLPEEADEFDLAPDSVPPTARAKAVAKKAKKKPAPAKQDKPAAAVKAKEAAPPAKKATTKKPTKKAAKKNAAKKPVAKKPAAKKPAKKAAKKNAAKKPVAKKAAKKVAKKPAVKKPVRKAAKKKAAKKK